MWIRSLALVAWAFVCVSGVSAQEPGDGRSWCLRGGTPETCKAFWITEFGASLPVYVHLGGGDPLFTWELGAMGSVSPRGALGAAVFVTAGKGGSQGGRLIGVRARYRHWLIGSTTLDGAVGLYKRLRGSGGRLDVTSQAALGLADWIAITTQVDFFGGSRCVTFGPTFGDCVSTEAFTDVIWYVGARMGAVPGIATGIFAMMAASMASFTLF